jgi:NAD(P)-dependent dehydrogenase (short-subunit alcohol dehydrogenase family)
VTPLPELLGLEGRVAIVTGGAGGLGLEMARALAEAGADVVVCSRDGDRCVEIARALGGRALGLRCDVRSESEVDAAVGTVMETLGRIDVLVNNAGTARSASPEETRLEDWHKVLDVNLTGTFLMARRVGRELIAGGRGGRIVNVSSMAGLVGAPSRIMDAVAYSTSKGAVVSFTRDLAVKWAPHGITVNALAPGWFPSEMTRGRLSEIGDELLDRIPLARYGTPDDLRGTIVFLASAASAYITGHTLVVDGGWTAR